MSKYQSIVNFNVQFNVTSHNKQYRSPLMVINVSKLPPRLMAVTKNKNKIKSFTDLPTLLFSEPLVETSNLLGTRHRRWRKPYSNQGIRTPVLLAVIVWLLILKLTKVIDKSSIYWWFLFFKKSKRVKG